jgi:NodT family efflux transporter outer membrane factor (OMF) lipoprotein
MPTCPPPSRLGAIAAAAALLLGGCATALAPPPPAPAPAAPAAWSAPLPPPGTPALPPPEVGVEAIGGPLFARLVAAALVASPDLASARTAIARARAARAAAASAGRPQVSAQAAAQRGDSGAGAATSASVGLAASWELDLHGGLAGANAAAEARLKGALVQQQAVQLALAAEVADTGIALRACEAQLEPARADTAARENVARLTELAARAGLRAPAESLQARASAAQGRAQLAAQAAQCEVLVKSLAALTAVPEATLRAELQPGTGRVPVVAAFAPPALPAELLARRPDVVQAALEVEAAAGDDVRARSRLRPSVTLSGALALGALRAGGEGWRDANTWAIGPLAVSLPLFDRTALAADATAARAAYDEAVARLQAGLRSAVRDVESALVTLAAVAARRLDAETAAADFEAVRRATQARFDGGLASLFELEDARRNAAAATTALIDLQREQAQAYVALFRAAGGGFTVPRELAPATATAGAATLAPPTLQPPLPTAAR